MDTDEESKRENYKDGGNFWQYSPQYERILSEGRLKPPPSLGSPSFVWHIGLWPKRMPGEQTPENARDNDVINSPLDSNGNNSVGIGVGSEVISQALKANYRKYDADNERFFIEISEFATRLQSKGRIKEADFENLSFTKPEVIVSESSHDSAKEVYQFGVCDPQSISFTLWWEDESGWDPSTKMVRLNERQSRPKPGSLRVRVHIQTFIDHATISFFIDAAKRYGDKQIYHINDVHGRRLTAIADHLFALRSMATAQVENGYVDEAILPEKGISDELDEKLNGISEYFYEGIWRELADSFDFAGRSSGKSFDLVGERFADFRGVAFGTEGIKTETNVKLQENTDKIRESAKVKTPVRDAFERTANIGFGPFPVFDNTGGEPNTVVKSYWPFIRRTTPGADYKDFVACGIIESRALYITGLGSPGVQPAYEEWPAPQGYDETRIWPNGYWPREGAGDSNFGQSEHSHAEHEWSGKSASPTLSTKPLRYLIITKGEPHREQIGRFIERINAIGTMRLFSLKSMNTIRNAGTYLRILGRALDGILTEWSIERDRINRWYNDELRKYAGQKPARPSFGGLWTDPLTGTGLDTRKPGAPINIQTTDEIDAQGKRVALLGNAIRQTEEKLVALGAELDKIGQGGSGRLLHVISRSKYFISEFERMWPTLEIRNVDGWINYEQFVVRNLKPTFDYIKVTGDQLMLLQERLQDITNTIQTSALILEAEATRTNTYTLRAIAANLVWWKWPLMILVFTSLIGAAGTLAEIYDFLRRLGQ